MGIVAAEQKEPSPLIHESLGESLLPLAVVSLPGSAVVAGPATLIATTE